MDKQTLERYIKECRTIKEISEKTGMGYSTVRRYLKKYGLSGDSRGAQRTWSDKDLVQAIKESSTKTEVIERLGLSSKSSGNYQTIDNYIKKLGLDTSHFTGCKPNTKVKYSTKELLVKNGHPIKSYNLKNRLVKEGLLNYLCSICNIKEWNGKKIVLQLDHIDGDRHNNQLSNLRLLCPNCHSQTETFCKGKP